MLPSPPPDRSNVDTATSTPGAWHHRTMAQPEPRRRRRLLRVVVVVVLALVAMMGLVYGFQRSLIYFPDDRAVPPAADAIPGAEDITLTTADGLDLTAWYVPPSGEDRDLAVLMAPGNGGNRSDRAGLAGLLAERGFAVLLLEYRGFGGNPGSPSEEGLHTDALAAVTALTELGHPPSSTIYLGESLGTGVMAALAAEVPPAGVVLRSPFTSLADAGQHLYPILPVRLILRDTFPVLEHVADLELPVSVIYGEDDTIVPSGQSATVANAAPQLVEVLRLPGVGHNDAVMFGAEVADVVDRLADSLPARE